MVQHGGALVQSIVQYAVKHIRYHKEYLIGFDTSALSTATVGLVTQVYAIALYVEAERTAKELGVRQRGGFFDDNVDAD
jgi:hypothetical protein